MLQGGAENKEILLGLHDVWSIQRPLFYGIQSQGSRRLNSGGELRARDVMQIERRAIEKPTSIGQGERTEFHAGNLGKTSGEMDLSVNW